MTSNVTHYYKEDFFFALIRVRLVVNVSLKTGESNLHHIYADFVMDYNKANKHVKLCHMINLDS